MEQSGLPLSDFKVIDLTVARAGPTAVRQLADWGADVIRIEPPASGESMTGTGRYGPDFQNLHRNKRCLTINLKEERGLEIFFKLVRDADVVFGQNGDLTRGRTGQDLASKDTRPHQRSVWPELEVVGDS